MPPPLGSATPNNELLREKFAAAAPLFYNALAVEVIREAISKGFEDKQLGRIARAAINAIPT